MGLSLPHLVVVALVIVLLFGRGRISEMMGDFGKGLKSFRQGMNDDAPAAPVRSAIVDAQAERESGTRAQADTRTGE